VVEHEVPVDVEFAVDGTDDIEEIDPADVLPVVFISWDAPVAIRARARGTDPDHVCDELCDPPGDDDGDGSLEPVPDYGGVDDGFGTVFSDADPGL